MADDGRVPSSDAISSLRAELMEAMRESRGEELRFALGPVELEFQLVATIEVGAGGGVRFWVVNADAKGVASDGEHPHAQGHAHARARIEGAGRHRGRARDVRAAPRGRSRSIARAGR